MKKLNIMLLGALALAFTACDDETTYGIAQENPQLPIASANGVTVGYADPFTGSAIDLNNWYETVMPVMDPAKNVVDADANLPKDYVITYQLFLSDKEDMANPQILTLAADGSIDGGKVLNAFKEFYQNDPRTLPLYTGVAVYVNYVNEASGLTQSSRLGGDGFLYLKKKIEFTPIDLQLDVEDAYYLVTSAGTPATSIANGLLLSHSNQHAYNDDTFKLTFEVSSTPFYWAVVPQSLVDANGSIVNAFGPAATGNPAATKGTLAQDGEQGVINKEGTYIITVNMLAVEGTEENPEGKTPTFSITIAADELYTPGPANGWGFDNNYLLTTKDYVNYEGVVYVQEMFKLTAGAGWDTNWGSDAPGTLNPGGANIEVDKAGLYLVKANLDALTFETLYFNSIGLIGNFNGWGSQLNLTPNDDASHYTGEVTFAEAGEGFLIRMNDNWDYKIGGDFDNLQYGGADMHAPGAGTYAVDLDLSKAPMTITFTAK